MPGILNGNLTYVGNNIWARKSICNTITTYLTKLRKGDNGYGCVLNVIFLYVLLNVSLIRS